MANYRLFIAKAPAIMDSLKRDFGFSTVQAAAILGNLGHECNGFQSMQEIHPDAGRGGYGWSQWTGPRRRAFEAWCDDHGLDIDSDQANYGFLKKELSSTHANARRALLEETDLVRAVRVFERKFLVAGVPHYPSRERYAEIALEAYNVRGGTAGLAIENLEIGEEMDWLESGLDALEGGVAFARRPSSMARLMRYEADCGCAGGAQARGRPAVESVPSPLDVFASEPAAGAFAAGPLIHDTASWSARPAKSAITVLNRRPKGIVIHHTASPNVADTSLAHAKQLARNIQNFHMGLQRNWIDTGQHFTVSRGGHILEGRHHSLEAAMAGQRHVLGAHAGSACNTDYVGIENEGTYMTGLPPAMQWGSLVQLCAWLCNQYGMNSRDIIGHRECKSTDCPGDRLFAQLGKLRQDVEDAR
jgi:hypothetical protein